jgi:hypothetical protein
MDNGELFTVEGLPGALQRYTSPANWAKLPSEWKAEMLDLCVSVIDKKLRRAERKVQNA